MSEQTTARPPADRAPSDRPVPDPLTDPTAAAMMTAHLVGIAPDLPLSEVLRLMAVTGVRHLPVMDGPRCTGLVVEVDVVRCVAQGGPFASAWSVLAGEIARPVERLPSTATRTRVAREMRATGADAVLVVDDGRVCGIVTATDLVRSLAGPDDRGAPPASRRDPGSTSGPGRRDDG